MVHLRSDRSCLRFNETFRLIIRLNSCAYSLDELCVHCSAMGHTYSSIVCLSQHESNAKLVKLTKNVTIPLSISTAERLTQHEFNCCSKDLDFFSELRTRPSFRREKAGTFSLGLCYSVERPFVSQFCVRKVFRRGAFLT